MPIHRRPDMQPVTGTSYPEPHNEGMGRYHAWDYSAKGGLTQFGVAYEVLEPGARSSLRHWHEREDEFMYLVSGELTLIDDQGRHLLKPGDACTWKAGVQNGHCLENHTDAPAAYIIVGTKAAEDVCHYPDADLVYTRKDGKAVFTSRDGTVLKEREL